jgi:hypothetical protein
VPFFAPFLRHSCAIFAQIDLKSVFAVPTSRYEHVGLVQPDCAVPRQALRHRATHLVPIRGPGSNVMNFMSILAIFGGKKWSLFTKFMDVFLFSA